MPVPTQVLRTVPHGGAPTPPGGQGGWGSWAPLWLPGLAVLALDWAGLDRPLAHAVGGLQGFPWQHHWLLTTVLHSGARGLGWALLLALTLGLFKPWGPLKGLATHERRWLVASIWLAVLVVVGIKGVSTTACPWDLAEFGGNLPYVSHWSWAAGDALQARAGHCFPAGHASTAFAFLAVPVWLKARQPARARRWLVGVLCVGMVLGLAQQARGAHFLSHTLWSAWLCWATVWLLHRRLSRSGLREVGL